jgi:homoserine dehydrogenase
MGRRISSSREMGKGRTYDEALGKAQMLGYAENDPSDDVDGHDSVAKCLILATCAFGKTLQPDQVLRRGISGVSHDDIKIARGQGKRIKHLVSLDLNHEGELQARVEPASLLSNDPLALVDGVNCGISIDAAPLNRVTIMGPGAGKELAGQGVFADLIAVARQAV